MCWRIQICIEHYEWIKLNRTRIFWPVETRHNREHIGLCLFVCMYVLLWLYTNWWWWWFWMRMTTFWCKITKQWQLPIHVRCVRTYLLHAVLHSTRQMLLIQMSLSLQIFLPFFSSSLILLHVHFHLLRSITILAFQMRAIFVWCKSITILTMHK